MEIFYNFYNSNILLNGIQDSICKDVFYRFYNRYIQGSGIPYSINKENYGISDNIYIGMNDMYDSIYRDKNDIPNSNSKDKYDIYYKKIYIYNLKNKVNLERYLYIFDMKMNK